MRHKIFLRVTPTTIYSMVTPPAPNVEVPPSLILQTHRESDTTRQLPCDLPYVQLHALCESPNTKRQHPSGLSYVQLQALCESPNIKRQHPSGLSYVLLQALCQSPNTKRRHPSAFSSTLSLSLPTHKEQYNETTAPFVQLHVLSQSTNAQSATQRDNTMDELFQLT